MLTVRASTSWHRGVLGRQIGVGQGLREVQEMEAGCKHEPGEFRVFGHVGFPPFVN
jgi:hypothetical protein